MRKSEIVILVLAVLVFVIGVVGHLAGASFANSDMFGYFAAPVPFVIGLLAFIAYKYAAAHDQD
ncbi:hypothetical protein [Pseudoalteromonas denitrificans]|uniref:DUF3098 domain-containing protein n=1 Tax=Pseudoalteromonas denitrificans DSM 6059 TaxID=1123010 RepID=A0A1I1UQU6_9GAMM|nr:hypothetical protein [Pseudoalteromonas denitrificans]SFD73157.1 hypothetical protein SAMN02745724_05311 [Pseudoalteromonas denitrificans DSM 6059]